MPQQYPFSAVVGSDDMALALILTTISPSVGGVLVRGEKGTAKSTIVRALADILPPIEVFAGDRFATDPNKPGATSPDGPFADDAPTETRPIRLVELPVGATEDRVLGSLHLQKALSEGTAEFEPGLLARAHRGILYVDEVNLLHDHLVDLLLDAAAMGSSTVERDGISISHEARFVLVGTMNPEEGELRPQLLDRFGLTVEVAAPRDPAVRVEVVKRRLAFEADPEGFAASYADAEQALTDRIVAAQRNLDSVALTDSALIKIAEICAAFDVDGMRADIVTARAAAAHAAWHGRDSVGKDDIRVAARLALPHRRRRNPFDAPGIDEELLDRLLDDDPDPPTDPPPDGTGEAEASADPADTSDEKSRPEPDRNAAEERQSVTSDAGDTDRSPNPDGTDTDGTDTEATEDGPQPTVDADDRGVGDTDLPGRVADAGAPYRPRLFTVTGIGDGEAGGRSRAVTDHGRRRGSRAPDGTGGSIHLTETIRAAAPHQMRRRGTTGAVVLRPEDLRIAIREGRESNLVLFCVDASGSMAARRRMEQVKTAILSLLLDAYQRRDKVGLITFRGRAAELALPPTSSVDIAARRLAELPAGGRTPLAEGLLQAAETIERERLRDPHRRTLLVVVTDGRATAGDRAVERSLEAARHLAAGNVSSLVVDCETGRFRMQMARALAAELAARYVPLGEIDATTLTSVIRRELPGSHAGPDDSAPTNRGVA